MQQLNNKNKNNHNHHLQQQQEQEWRQQMKMIVFTGELYSVGLLPEAMMHAMLAQLLESIEKGRTKNIEPLCKLLCIIGPTLQSVQQQQRQGQRQGPRRCSPHCGLTGCRRSGGGGGGGDDDDQGSGSGSGGGIFEHCMSRVEHFIACAQLWSIGERLKFMLYDVVEMKKARRERNNINTNNL